MKNQKYDAKHVLQCYLMIAPQLIGFFLITLYPILWAIHKAFYYYDGIISATRFVGVENFLTLFTKDSAYWGTWLTTLEFTAMKLPFELPFAMIIALLINKKMKGKSIMQTVFYMPSIIGVAIIGLIFFTMFDYFGIVNAALQKYGLISGGIEWFSHKWTAMTVLVLGSVWSTFGINALYFLAALQNIPTELHEAALLDGITKRQEFFKITLPMMAPVLQIILLLSINGTLHTNEYILVMTGGGPGGRTHTVMSYIVGKFVPGFSGGSVNIGYGCTVSFITSIMMAIIAAAYMKLSERLRDVY